MATPERVKLLSSEFIVVERPLDTVSCLEEACEHSEGKGGDEGEEVMGPAQGGFWAPSCHSGTQSSLGL